MSLLELHTRSLALAAEVITTVQPEQLVLATPCAGWTLRRLLEHVVGQHRGSPRPPGVPGPTGHSGGTSRSTAIRRARSGARPRS